MGLGQNHAAQEFHDVRPWAIFYPAILAFQQNFNDDPVQLLTLEQSRIKRERARRSEIYSFISFFFDVHSVE